MLMKSFFKLFLFVFFFSFLYFNDTFAVCVDIPYPNTTCEAGEPYPMSCDGTNATFCTDLVGVSLDGNPGIYSCVAQYVDVRQQTVYGIDTNKLDENENCPIKPPEPACGDAPLTSLPNGLFTICSHKGFVNVCGDGIKQATECCDGGGPGGKGPGCMTGCICEGTSAPICGDAMCNGYETGITCPGDCSASDTSVCSTNPLVVAPWGQSYSTIYQGDSGAVGSYRIYSGNGNLQTYNVSITGCPSGATCSGDLSNMSVNPSDTPYYNIGTITMTNTSSVAPGVYTVNANITSASEPTCGFTMQYQLTVEPSRQSVCDSVWHKVPPSPVGYGLIGGSVGASYEGGFLRASAISRKEQASGFPISCSYINYNANTFCRSSNWTTNTCTWDMPVNVADTFYCNPNTFVGGWSNGGAIPGTSTVTDPAGRVYEFRKVPSLDVIEYKCSEVPGTFSGRKLNKIDNTDLLGTTATVTISGPAGTFVAPPSGANSNPFSFGGLTPGIYTLISSVPSGYDVFYDLDFSNGISWVSGSSASINLLPGQSINARWGYEVIPVSGDLTANSGGVGQNVGVSVPYNMPVNISWTSNNASSCVVSPPNWTGLSGSQSLSLVSDITYTLNCNGGPVEDTLFVDVSDPTLYNLNVIKAGSGTVVSSSPSGIINCGADCSEANIVQDTSITLSAVPANGRIFTGWTIVGGGVCSGVGNCTIVMDGNKTVTANFAVNPNFKEF